jgi:hypothetical protein
MPEAIITVRTDPTPRLSVCAPKTVCLTGRKVDETKVTGAMRDKDTLTCLTWERGTRSKHVKITLP